MPKPRMPTNILKLRGGLKNRPGRAALRENEPENTNGIGKPPAYLSSLEKKAFNEIVRLSIAGVLGEADRLAVKMAINKMATCLLVKCRGLHEVDGEIIAVAASEQSLFF